MKTVKAKIKGTSAVLEGCLCDDSFFVPVDHDTFERYDLDEVEICKEPVNEGLEEAAKEYATTHLRNNEFPTADSAFIAGAEWQYQKDRREFAKLKAKEWSDGYNDGFARGKEQMLKEAEECDLYYDGDFLAIDLNMAALGYSERDKVKIVIIPEKEDTK